MPWILVDVLLALVALAVLGLLALRLWRGVKRLSATVTAATDQVGVATEALSTAMASGPLGADAPRSPAVPGAKGPDRAPGA